MSARTKVNGNRALRCDIPDCTTVYVAQWWGNGAAEARWQAGQLGWGQTLTIGETNRLIDLCPEHHAQKCRMCNVVGDHAPLCPVVVNARPRPGRPSSPSTVIRAVPCR